MGCGFVLIGGMLDVEYKVERYENFVGVRCGDISVWFGRFSIS